MILKRCKKCKKQRLWFLVKRQEIKLPIGKMALSKEEMCHKCIGLIRYAIKLK